MPSRNWRTVLLIVVGIVLIAAEAVWIYAPLGFDLSPAMRIGLTIGAAIFVALAGLSAILFEKKVEREHREFEKQVRELQATRDAFLETIATYVDTRMRPIVEVAQRLAADPILTGRLALDVRLLQFHAERMRAFTSDVRDLVAIEQGRLSVDVRQFDLRDLVTQTIDQMQPIAKQYGVTLRLSCEASLPVRADPRRMRGILQDLVRNGFNFTPSQGSVHVFGGPHESFARITVKDSGRGLTPEEAGKLFVPFARVHRAGETRDEGAGLRLFLAKHVIEAQRGRIWVESDGYRTGCAFIIELPLDERPFDLRNAPPPPSGTPSLPPALDQPGVR